MRKINIYIFLIVFAFYSCEEYYTPELENVEPMLVVEAHITNDLKQNFVKLSMTSDFYSQSLPVKVTGARVDLVELAGTTTRAIEQSDGYFTFNRIPTQGRTYILRIQHKGNTYESGNTVMPPLPKLDSLYTEHKIEKRYVTNAYGVPSQIEIPGREIYVDAGVSSSLSNYRFNWRAVLQWTYSPPATSGPAPPPYYGWISRVDRNLFNIAGPKEFSVPEKIRKHKLLLLAYDGNLYLDSIQQYPLGWIVIADIYGITKTSFSYYEKLNKQFSAEGSLFDPILTQVYGNIFCKNDPSKIVLGFFDLKSYRQYRYYMNLGYGNDKDVIIRQIHRYPDIPDGGLVVEFQPEFWEHNFR